MYFDRGREKRKRESVRDIIKVKVEGGGADNEKRKTNIIKSLTEQTNVHEHKQQTIPAEWMSDNTHNTRHNSH